ncbi:MAG: amidohydrolase family protein [Bacillota bacterium]
MIAIKILIKNGIVILNCCEYKKAHLIINNGIIEDVLNELPESAADFDEIIDAEGKIVAPGLINGHTHSYANYFKTTVDNLPLEEMMLYIVAEGDSLQPEDVYYNTMLGAIEMIRNGITGCLDQLAQKTDGLNAAMSAYEKIGMRAVMAPMLSDMGYYDTLPVGKNLLTEDQKTFKGRSADELIQINMDFLNKWHGKHGRLKVGFGPSGPQRCTKEFMQKSMANAIDNDTVFHTHTLETRTQKNTAHLLYGKGMVYYLDDIGCLNERLTMAHGVWMTPEEAALAAERGATVAHCPACNLYLGSGIASVNTFREVGLNVGLGTDGPNGGCNQSMLEIMKIASLLHRVTELDSDKWVTAGETLKFATVNNAKILGMEKELGEIAKGYRADVVIYNPDKSIAFQPLTDPIMQLVMGETGSAVETVLVQGVPVLRDGKFTTIDEKAMLKDINKHGEIVRERLAKKIPAVAEEVKFLKSILPRDF